MIFLPKQRRNGSGYVSRRTTRLLHRLNSSSVRVEETGKLTFSGAAESQANDGLRGCRYSLRGTLRYLAAGFDKLPARKVVFLVANEYIFDQRMSLDFPVQVNQN